MTPPIIEKGDQLIALHPIQDSRGFISPFESVVAASNAYFRDQSIQIKGRVVDTIIVPMDYVVKPEKMITVEVDKDAFELHARNFKSFVSVEVDAGAKVAYSTVVIKNDMDFILRRVTAAFTNEPSVKDGYVLLCLAPYM